MKTLIAVLGIVIVIIGGVVYARRPVVVIDPVSGQAVTSTGNVIEAVDPEAAQKAFDARIEKLVLTNPGCLARATALLESKTKKIDTTTLTREQRLDMLRQMDAMLTTCEAK